MAKKRVPISTELSAEVMFASDRTCCVCNERGKSVQIHHIDEDPSHNTFDNLAVLCLQCHDDTQITGGFGRKLNAELVLKYRDKWYSRVSARREEVDRKAIERVVGTKKKTTPIATVDYSEERSDSMLEYVNSLPEYGTELKAKLRRKLDSGVTATMVQATYDYIDALQGILVVSQDSWNLTLPHADGSRVKGLESISTSRSLDISSMSHKRSVLPQFRIIRSNFGVSAISDHNA